MQADAVCGTQISITATLPAVFNRNIFVQGLLGALKQDQFDVAVELQMCADSVRKFIAGVPATTFPRASTK